MNVLKLLDVSAFVETTLLFEDGVQMYNDDPEAIYAVIAMVLASIFLQANVYVTLRMLKGMQFTALLQSSSLLTRNSFL